VIEILASTAAGLRRAVHVSRRVGLNLLFPPRCAFCDVELPGSQVDPLLCGKCRSLLGPAAVPSCPRCGAAVSTAAVGADGCRRCRNVRLKFDTVVPLGAYRGQLRSAVLKMKHPAGDHLSAAVGRLFGQRRGAEVAALRPDLVVPVPMHWTRRLARGTNSAELLAAGLSRHLGVRLARQILVRCRNTLPQADLPPSRRFQNVRGAFRLKAGYDLEGRRVVLVDDILTTGATCSEAAKVFREAGVAMVAAAVVARAEGEHPD